MKHSKIAIVIGTKAELIKCMPLMLELQNRKLDFWFIHTGQHPLGKICEDFGLKKPDYILSKESIKETKFWSKVNKSSFLWFFSTIFKVKVMIQRIKPRYVIYHGDTMSTAAAAMGSSKILNFKKNWKNAHLEAGLRSGSLWEPFPEEISRKISDRFSDILLAPSKQSEFNLKRIYKKKKIFNVGNTIVDSALIVYKKSKQTQKEKNYVLINIHRHENINNKQRMENIVEIICSIKSKAIWPLHENTKYYLEKYGLMKKLLKTKNLEITPLVNYSTFISLMARCKYLVIDGGSIQEESLIFKKPCIILRKRTERPEGLKTKINFLTKLNVNLTKKIIKDLEENKIRVKKFENPYGKEGLSKKIVDWLLK